MLSKGGIFKSWGKRTMHRHTRRVFFHITRDSGMHPKPKRTSLGSSTAWIMINILTLIISPYLERSTQNTIQH